MAPRLADMVEPRLALAALRHGGAVATALRDCAAAWSRLSDKREVTPEPTVRCEGQEVLVLDARG